MIDVSIDINTDKHEVWHGDVELEDVTDICRPATCEYRAGRQSSSWSLPGRRVREWSEHSTEMAAAVTVM